jgi:cytochrome b6-f complex iron-sulfur subunit
VTQEKRSRREFCTQACLGLSTAAVGSLLQGCNTFTYPTAVQGLESLSGSESGGTLVVSIDAASPLAPVGGAVIVPSSAGPLLVVRTGADAFTALNGTCTHRVCSITGYANQTFVCPCHGSEFDTAGRVVSGPARVPLATHATRFSNDVLTISL